MECHTVCTGQGKIRLQFYQLFVKLITHIVVIIIIIIANPSSSGYLSSAKDHNNLDSLTELRCYIQVVIILINDI